MSVSVTAFLWRYARKMKIFCFLILSGICVATVSSRFVNYFSAEIVDAITTLPQGEELYHKIAVCLLLVFASLLVQTVIFPLMRFLDTIYLPHYLGIISKDLFISAHKHSTTFFAEEMAGNISSKIKTITNNAETMYYHLMGGLLFPLFTFVSGFVFIAKVNVYLALCFVAFCILFLSGIVAINKKITPLSVKKAKLMSESNGILVDSITNFDLVKNCANFHYEKLLYFSSLRSALKALRKESRTAVSIEILTRFLNDLMSIAFYLLIFAYWYWKNLSVGDVVLVMSLISSMIHSSRDISFFARNFVQLAGGIRDGLELLSKPEDVKDRPDALFLEVGKGRVEFSGVTYGYKDSQTLFEDFNLNIKPGEKVGLVGHSGSGKSTLVRLLSRYYDIQNGQILIDGQDIRNVTQYSLRRNIALIPQEATLFNRSIFDNIRYGNVHAGSKDVYAAAKKAYIHDFIERLPNKYDSKVGERGIMLSGGERQRIAIARAILKNAPILILDEATSALDSESEYYIQQALKELMKNKTVIAIAHRLSTLKEMDRIIVMDNGRIVEEGTHKQLLRKKGAYYNFYNMQSSGFFA